MRDHGLCLGVGLGEILRGYTNIDTATGQYFCGPQVSGGGSVGFDQVIMGGIARGGHAPGGVVHDVYLGPERTHAIEGQVHIATGADVLAGQRHFNRCFAARRQHQQGRYVLAGQASVNLKTPGLDLARAMHRYRWATGGAVDLDAVLAQGGQQRADRAFLHVLVTVQYHGALHGGDGSREKAHGGAGVAEEQRLGRQLQRALAGDDKGGVVRLVDGDAHLPQGDRHMACVIAFERAAQTAGALGQCREQQSTVGNGFGAGGRDLASEGEVGRCNGHGFLRTQGTRLLVKARWRGVADVRTRIIRQTRHACRVSG